MLSRFSAVIILILCLLPLAIVAGTGEKCISKDYRKAARRYRFKIRQDAQFPVNISGVPLAAKAAEKELANFFDALEELGSGFVKKSGLKQVVICRNLKLNGMKCAGVAKDDCMYLAQGATKKIIFHELFHIFDPKRKNKEWTSLNNRQFRYWGINYPNRQITPEKRRSIADYYRKTGYKFARDFVSNYAQTSEVEDRAETFAVMLVEGSDFQKRTQKSIVLFRKMQFIIDLTGRSSLLGRNFWKEKLGSWISD